MAIRPISFNSPMVRAILSGKKTQTRRVVKLDIGRDNRFPIGKNTVMNIRDPQAVEYAPIKRGDVLWLREPGRVVAYQHNDCPANARMKIEYPSGNNDPHDLYNPTAWMPCPERFYNSKWAREHQGIPNGIFKEAARLFLKVTDVRAEWLQSITAADVEAEGVPVVRVDDRPEWVREWHWGPTPDRPYYYDFKTKNYHGKSYDNEHCMCNVGQSEKLGSAQCAFKVLWDLVAKKGQRWADAPWVWVFEFELCERPTEFLNA